MSAENIALEDGGSIGAYCELQVEASSLANMDVFSLSDPFALLEERRNGKWVELGKHCQISNTDSCVSLLRV